MDSTIDSSIIDPAIYQTIRALPVNSEHEHHMPDSWFHAGMTLDKSMANAYVHWTGHAPDGTVQSRRDVLQHVRYNTYFTWFEKGVQAIYGIDDRIELENWDAISERVTRAYADNPDFHVEILKQHGYRTIIQDAYWNPGDDMGHPDLFFPAMRVDKFMHGHHQDCVTLNDFHVWKRYGFTGGTLDDYVAHMSDIIRTRHAEGRLAALKCADAYLRTLNFQPDDYASACAAFNRDPKSITPEQKTAFSNYIFNRSCELAAELDVPFQIHTGLGDLSGSNPMNLESSLAAHPKTRFVLFHSGYPWVSQVGGLAHNYPNAFPSLTWTVTISTTAAVRALHEYIDIGHSINSILWGADCHVPEDSIGAMLAWKYVVARVLSERYRAGMISHTDVDILANKFMFENVAAVYKLDARSDGSPHYPKTIPPST